MGLRYLWTDSGKNQVLTNLIRISLGQQSRIYILSYRQKGPQTCSEFLPIILGALIDGEIPCEDLADVRWQIERLSLGHEC